MKRLAAALVALGIASAAHAENCTRSLDYIFNDLGGSLPLTGQSYQSLFKVCQDTLKLVNVRDAYILRDGGIAVLPFDFSVIATAGTLAEFCRLHPRGRLRILGKREVKKGLTVGLVVLKSSTGLDTCQEIRGRS